MKDDENRKDFRRENLNNRKKHPNRLDQFNDTDVKSSRSLEDLKKRKEQIDEEDWEEWERFYNR